jgi:hypothetical protein
VRQRSHELDIERQFAPHDALGQQQGELHHLPLGLVDHRLPELGDVLDGLRHPPDHRVGTARARLDTGTFAGSVALGERLALERGQMGVDLCRRRRGGWHHDRGRHRIGRLVDGRWRPRIRGRPAGRCRRRHAASRSGARARRRRCGGPG